MAKAFNIFSSISFCVSHSFRYRTLTNRMVYSSLAKCLAHFFFSSHSASVVIIGWTPLSAFFLLINSTFFVSCLFFFNVKLCHVYSLGNLSFHSNRIEKKNYFPLINVKLFGFFFRYFFFLFIFVQTFWSHKIHLLPIQIGANRSIRFHSQI